VTSAAASGLVPGFSYYLPTTLRWRSLWQRGRRWADDHTDLYPVPLTEDVLRPAPSTPIPTGTF